MRLFLLVSLVAFLPVYAHAQYFESQLVLGVNASQIDGDALWGYNKPGFLAGAQVGYPFSKTVSLQTGLLYSAKGSRHGKNDPQFFIWRLNYVEIPLVIKADVFKGIYFSGGLTTNYLITSKVDAGYGFSSSRKGFKDFDFCYLASVAYQPFDHTAFQIRLINGLGSANRLEYYRNRSLSFAVLFDLSGS